MDTTRPPPAADAPPDRNPIGWDQAALVICLCGAVLNTLLVASILTSKTLRNQAETILNSNLATSDLLLSVLWSAKYISILQLGFDKSPMRFSFYCDVEGFFMSTVYTSMLTLTSIAVYNYGLLVPDKWPTMSRKFLFLWSGSLWLIGIAFSSTPILFGMRYIHHTTTTYCAADVNTPATTTLAKLVFDVPVFTSCVGIINYSYYMILRKFSVVQKRMDVLGMKNSNTYKDKATDASTTPALNMQRSQEAAASAGRAATGSINNNNNNSNASGPDTSVKRMARNPQSLRIKMAIIKRAIFMTVGFLMCWTVSICCLLYQSISATYVSTTSYSVGMITAYFSVVVNPMVFFTIDKNYRRALFTLLRLPKSWIPTAYTGSTDSSSAQQGGSVKRSSSAQTPLKIVAIGDGLGSDMEEEYEEDNHDSLDAADEHIPHVNESYTA
ncbi:hypothetical protein BC831DRAFT_442521 [Entophlyctis helioformis]|nr:hypothetical protein BC831DRAFT_442521 [Entophlyctis helioformis]